MSPSAGKTAGCVFFGLACLCTFLYVGYYAWVCDDAYITFRVVDHFVHGYGLRWNIDERVQVYTHPLWMLLHIPFYALWGNIFWVTIAFSAATGIMAARFLINIVDGDYLSKAILVLLPLALSKTFHDHIISGLETPLTLCLLGCFYYDLIRAPHRIYRLLFIASLAVLNRFDTAVMLLPPMLWLALRMDWKSLRLPRAALAISPLLGWWVFSLLYYGFIFPNTKYAKLNTGIALKDYMAQGAYYLQDFASYDAFSFTVIVAALLYPCFAILKNPSATDRSPLPYLVGCSILFYLFYIICVGGDFMAGRFLVAPFYLALFSLAFMGRGLTQKKLLVLAAIMVAIFGLQQAFYGVRTVDEVLTHHGIADEREFYKETNTVFTPGSWEPRREVTGKWRDLGEAAWDPENAHHIAVYGYTGVYGFYADPRLVIIDWNALSDPLLARLPIPDPKAWRIGHFERTLPEGYLLARQTGNTSHMAEPIRRYYEKLQLVTSGDVFAGERLAAIAGFQLGQYEKWRKTYLQTEPPYAP